MEEVLIKCDRLDYFGRGIGYVDGKIIFVANLLPLEEALVKVIIKKKKYMIGEVIKFIKKSSDRVIPRCSYVNCGCALQSLDYFKTLEFKKNKVTDILKRYSGLDNVVSDIFYGDKFYGYRNKISLKVKSGKLGYFKNGSNELIPISGCALASDKTNEIISILNKADLSSVSSIVIKDFGDILIDIKGNMDISSLKDFAYSIYMDDELVYGEENLLASLGDFKFYVSKDSFFQVNSDVTLKLYNKIIEFLGDNKNKTILDLYCGVGTISLFLSKHFKSVIGAEINREAIKCANLNQKLNNIDNVSFICGDASLELKKLKADFLVVDPPRSGLTLDGINEILRFSPEKIVYVSCDPMTLARDLNYFKDKYDIKEVNLFDMFPWTYHVESLVYCVRK